MINQDQADAIQREADQIRRRRLEAIGRYQEYQMWRETVPDLSEGDAYDTFMNSQVVEEGSLDGRTRAVTGGDEAGPATTPPTPGPDATGGRPDEAGEVSEGGGEGPAPAELEILGLWKPPEEAEAINYEPPPVRTMTLSTNKDWMENARKVWEFAGSPQIHIQGGPGPGTPGREEYVRDWEEKYGGITDDEIALWAKREMSQFNWNVASTMSWAHKLTTADDPQSALAFLNLMNMYEHASAGPEEFGRAVFGVMTDPTTYVGLGVGSVAARGAARTLAKKQLSNMIRAAVIGATAGSVEGGMLAGGFDLVTQNIEQEAGAREDLDLSRVAQSTAFGAGAGTLLGGAGGALVGRHMDKLNKAAEDALTRQLGGVTAEERRIQEGGNARELIDLIRRSAQQDLAADETDKTAKLVLDYLNNREGLPRHEDGTIDVGKLSNDLDEMLGFAGRQRPRGEGPAPDIDERRALEELEGPQPLPSEESQKFAERIAEMHDRMQEEVVPRTATTPGSRVRDLSGKQYEVMGRTQNGWYNLRERTTGAEINLRRNQFTVTEAHPAPDYAGPMNLDPFTTSAARIMALNERVVSGKLQRVEITVAEQQAIVKELQGMGINITEKNIAAHWTPAELLWLRDTYNAQANGMAQLARQLESQLRNTGRLTDEQLARFNQAHTQFVATRDLFFGVSGNAARQLQILKTRPTDEVYEFSQSLLDSISLQGGRANTERAITAMAQFAREGQGNPIRGVTRLSENIWGNQWQAAVLNARYNMMLSSWRTHFFNFTGNSLSGIYQHLVVSPIRMGINNAAYARDLARSVIQPSYKPDPADRITRHQWYAELRGHYEGFRDSLYLAKEIALGNDIGEGKVWNELGLRYNVVNVPQSTFGRLGTTPVRLLEAGDAFFKNQAFQSKIHELASIKARYEEIYNGADYQEAYRRWVNDPDAPMQRAAQEFAAKQTYTNDPNVYGGVLAALARGVAEAQNRSMVVNMIVPFVRTPANLLSYSMEMIGANTVLSPNKTLAAIMGERGQREAQEAMARLTAAAGLWLAVYESYQNGNITGVGPANWEERKVWEDAGWQPNSIRINGEWVAVDRAAPAGQSIATIASVFDFYALTQQQQPDVPAWIGAGLLYTADMILDESYLSTATDMLTAISSKEEARARSVVASMVNSMLVPNLMRDLRRSTDEQMRTTTAPNLLQQIQKQMMNASPWHSELLPPQRDWRGDPKNYWGNAYERGLIPFNLRDPQDTDQSSMALAYARIPITVPDRTMTIPRTTDRIDMFAMDQGSGFVYDKYLQFVGQRRAQAVDAVIESSFYRVAVENNEMGPGTDVEMALRQALAIGTRAGRIEMLGFLIDHSGENNTFDRGNGQTIQIQHQFSVAEYSRMRNMIRTYGTGGQEGIEIPEQLMLEQPVEGPQFFRP